MDKRDFIFRGAVSKRFHVEETHMTQDIAAHSFGVAWFCELLTDGRASKNLIMAALSHDLAEHRTGDIPSPAKRRLGVSRQFHEYEMDELRSVGLGCYIDDLATGEEITLKLADMLDGMMFCLRERRLGNRNVDPIFGRFQFYFLETLKKANENEAAASHPYAKYLAEQQMDEIVKEYEKL